MGRFLLALLFGVMRIASLVSGSRVELVDNGYVNLVVAITPATPRTQSTAVIENIKKIIKSANPVLYKATENRAYFKSVHILIPDSWNHLEASLSTWETFEKADVLVDTPNPKHQDVPYTRQNGLCGEPGERIHLTPNYVLTVDQEENNKQHGKPGKVFVHEWAHYRYGVFDEYGHPGDSQFPLFYHPPGSSDLTPNICANRAPHFSTLDIKTNMSTCNKDDVTGNYDENCRFFFKDDFKPESSLASYHQIDSIEHFCHDDQTHSHNYDAPNKHNAMCNQASAATIIMRNADFDGKNMAVDLSVSEMVTEFHIFRPTGPRFVLVLDVSGSMKDHDRIVKLGEATRTFIKNDVPTGSKLGMIKFSSEATVVSELKVITDAVSRQAMMDQVPVQLGAATCIGCGLEKAVTMLQAVGESGDQGGIIVLVTDGKNSPGYKDTYDVEPKIIKAGIRVITIALGREADESIEKLADITDGKAYFVNDVFDTSDALHEAFMGALTYQSSISNGDLHFKLYEKTVDIAKSDVVEAKFNVDPTLGRNLKLSVFNLDSDKSVLTMVLVGPEDQAADTKFDFDTTTASVKVDLAKAGEWNFVVELDKKKQTKDVVITVTTQLQEDTETAITTRCWVPNGADIKDATTNPVKVLAEVVNGPYAVIGATVRAFITKPDNEVELVDLLDNGANADTTADDGVYSRFFPNTTLTGRYSVKCQVITNETALERLGFIGSANPQLEPPEEKDFDPLPAGNFSRIVAGGSFQVEIPVSKYDAYPPGDVRDLSANLVDHTETNASIELRWTAPGDEIDWGIVNYYELKYSDDVLNLKDPHFDDPSPFKSPITNEVLVAGSLLPSQAGAQQSATFILNNIQKERPYYVALRAFDKANKCSRVSNMAVFFIPKKSAFVFIMDVDESETEIENEDDASYHTSSLVVAALGLMLIVSFCVALLTVVVKHSERSCTSYAVVPA